MYVELTKVSEIYSYDNQQCNFQGMHFLLGLNPMCPSNYYPCEKRKHCKKNKNMHTIVEITHSLEYILAQYICTQLLV
jgi:hypothetical protein